MTPTIGRRVHFYATPEYLRLLGVTSHDHRHPFDAGVAYVWSPGIVNLDVTDHAGNHKPVTSVAFVQEPTHAPHGLSCYATWPAKQ